MIIVMAASGDAETVRSPRQIWCFSDAEAGRASARLAAEYPADDMEVFSMEFPEIGEAAFRGADWRKTAEDCTELALVLYLEGKQTAVLEMHTMEPATQQSKPEAVPVLQIAA